MEGVAQGAPGRNPGGGRWTPPQVLLQHEEIFEVVVQPHLPSEHLSVEAIMEGFAKQVRPFIWDD